MESVDFNSIVEKASEYLHENECLEFSVIGINWDVEQHQWIVTFVSDYSNHEFINIWISLLNNKPRIMLHSFEKVITIDTSNW